MLVYFYGHLKSSAAICYTYVNGHLVDFVFFWYIFPVLVCCIKKNLATLEKGYTYKLYPLLQEKPTNLFFCEKFVESSTLAKIRTVHDRRTNICKPSLYYK
jgi:hypothetical protein